MKIQNPCYRLLTVATLALAGCGDGSGTAAVDKGVSFSGVAAVGAPMADAVITVRDATGAIFTTTADATGAYSFTNIAVTAPLQLQATAVMGDSNVTHYAVLPSLDAIRLVNVTPLTTAVASLISTSDIAAPMTAASIAALSATNIALATANINTVIKPMLTALGLPSNFNPMTSALTANGQDADLLLDHLNVAVRPTGVAISNRMATPTADANSTSADASVISKTLATRPTALSNATVTATDGFVALATKLQACFAINESLRLSNKTTATATLHADCQGIASATYLHNGTPFINRWATELNSSAFTGATFSKPVVRLKTKDAPERFSVNFNYKDNTGVGYTRPESIEKQADGSWLLAGNGKTFNFYPEAFLQYFDDVSTLPYNNTNYSVVESGLRLFLDPRFAFTASGAVSYPALDMTVSSGKKTGTSGYFKTLAAALPAGSKMVGCVIASGPGALNGAKWSGFHPNGVMMKRSDASDLQDYLAIDSIPSNAWRTAINAAKGDATGNLGAGRNVTEGSNTNICTQSGNRAGSVTTLTSSAATIWETASSRSLYTVEIEALGARTNVLTGATNDTTIAGRNVAWNTYVAYAREAPSAELSAVFDNNPLVTFEVFDTDGKLRAVYSSRLIGEIPPAIMAKAYFENNMVSKMDSATLSRYLNFAGNTATTQETQTTFTGTWTTPNGAFALDRVMLYSRIEKSETGPGLVASSSLWTSDPDLAATLNAITGTNFGWRNSGWARPTGTTSCSGDLLVSSTGVNVSRTTLSVVSSSLDGQYYYGGNQLASACIAATNSSSAPTKANVYRELGTRTYTDTNTRLYYYVSNKALR